ncbi:MAG TPA: hypothetical protein EYH44_00040 [Thermoprotei archaeon]|nr:hypothetical protein [Thermoprotei archaeon]
MGRTIPSASRLIDEEIRRLKKLRRRMDRRYWRAIDFIIKELKMNRHLIFQYNNPEDILSIPYIIIVKILTDKKVIDKLN